MIACAIFPIVILLQDVPLVDGEYCQYDDSVSKYYTYYKYCTDGCCGNKNSSQSDVCCSHKYTSGSSISSSLPGLGSILPMIMGIAGLFILIAIIRCCCAAAKSSSRQNENVIQSAHTDMQTCVVNTTPLPQGYSATPIQQGAVGYANPCDDNPPPYDQHEEISPKTADMACPPSRDAKY